MDYLDEDSFESIIKKLEDCKIQIEDEWNNINGFSVEKIEDAWQGADGRAFVEKIDQTKEYVEKINNKIDQTIEYFKKYIKIIEAEKQQNNKDEMEKNK